MRTWILSLAALALSACHPATPPAFVASARSAERLEVRPGVPRDTEAGANTLTIHGQVFYDHYLELNDADRKTIGDLIATESTYAPHVEGKKCGGFHANYLIAWRRDGAAYQVMVCFGCHEALSLGDGGEQYNDLSDSGYEALVRVLDRNNTQ